MTKHIATIKYPHALHPEIEQSIMLKFTQDENGLCTFLASREAVDDVLNMIAPAVNSVTVTDQ